MAAWSWPGPLVFTPHFHGTSASRLRALLHVPYRAVGRRIVERADRILCVTGAEQRALVERFPGAASKSQVISNGVDVDRLRQAPVVARSDGRPSIVVASRLEDYKRVDLVVEAMHELDGSFVLEIYGDGPARSALAAQVTRWGFEADVELHGRVPDGALASGLRRARCLVSMSNHEAQGMVLLEAAAVGTPVVASSIPAHEEVARTMDGSVRLVPPNSDPATIADAVRQATGLPRVEHAVPSWSDVIARTEAVYRVILASEQKVGAAATWPP
jgi:glycosyltransferase involved in cell wall biosynthesis